MKLEDIKSRLVDKSIEAFILGLEIYNKPTIRYRIEGFSFFICNAWELMLKAELLNRGESIYFTDSPNRTLSLRDALQRVYTDKKQPLRVNLETIIDLRDTSTHFITEDYETIYAPFFQACVINFCEQIKRFHKIDMSEHVSPNFLTLSISLDVLTNNEIRGKYSAEMADRFIANKSELDFLQSTNQSADLFIPIRHEFVQIKDKTKADFTYSVDSSSDMPAKIITKLQDPKDKYTLSRKNVISLVNKQINVKNIKFDYVSFKGDNVFNDYALKLIMDFYNLQDDERYCFQFVSTRRYSSQLVEFVIEAIKNDSNIVCTILKHKKR
ncbi:DUF3644 domain-containing protein [Lachnoanaerobaculum umeaense]|jgi:hypothetical protein|uniref:DUF3644 domain-containing protein n=1 Tax=Lachnoanaerobaculum umeaense TaxID=617123 RepID=A0A385Q158_9FIRM|nr:DUF3644 domain-containing protein [Lachnoanaerobaculum umeaense]AYB00101.1 DUF3644 domain-containing protein [Lachnoanaerobaculum umeaense]DAO88937.1 MAG TPA: Protein of unknown function (DUF3644) [Caudoviricetes sp.]